MDTEYLVTLHLRHISTSGPLRVRGLAQVAAKALYTYDREVGASDVRTDVGTLAEMPPPDLTDVETALGHLSQSGWAVEGPGGWSLSPTGRGEIQRQLTAQHQQLARIFERRFPSAIDGNALRGWFFDCWGEFFARYGTQVAASIKGVADGFDTP